MVNGDNSVWGKQHTKNECKRTESQRNVGNYYLYQHLQNIPEWEGERG